MSPCDILARMEHPHAHELAQQLLDLNGLQDEAAEGDTDALQEGSPAFPPCRLLLPRVGHPDLCTLAQTKTFLLLVKPMHKQERTLALDTRYCVVAT